MCVVCGWVKRQASGCVDAVEERRVNIQGNETEWARECKERNNGERENKIHLCKESHT